jgi:hypothetical protein
MRQHGMRGWSWRVIGEEGERYRRKTAVAMRRLWGGGEGCLSAIPILSKN